VRYDAPGERIRAEEISPMKELDEPPICSLVAARFPKLFVAAVVLESPTESDIRMVEMSSRKYKLQEISCQVFKVMRGLLPISIPAETSRESLDTSKLNPVVP
jgi:hypothetical protein